MKPDAEVLDFLVSRLETKAAVARALDVTPQAFQNWYDETRGISPAKRAHVWVLANDHGCELPRDWLLPKKDSAGPAPTEQAA